MPDPSTDLRPDELPIPFGIEADPGTRFPD